MRLIVSALIVIAALASARPVRPVGPQSQAEKHLKNIKQLTFDGENAEAYFSKDGARLIFQRAPKADGCDQIYSIKTDGSEMKQLSNGKGKTTCSYFTPDNKSIVYATTFMASESCPPRPDMSRGYVWSLYAGFDIVKANLDGSGIKRLTSTPRYDAEATIRPDGTIVFTSLRDGDLDIYRMDANGGKVRRLTTALGYDGGPFWSYDGKQIVFRAYHPESDQERAEYLGLLKDDLIRPSKLDIWVMDENGGNKKRVTNNGKANFAPFFFPSGKRIVFASNMDDPRARNFDIYAINVDGSGLERITFNDTFDGFPMFSPDGRKLVFASNRSAAKSGDTNVFIADWVD